MGGRRPPSVVLPVLKYRGFRRREGLGVIDTLSAGFGLINRRLWLILLPVALDLFLWYGPRLSIAPVAQETTRLLNQSMALSAEQPLAVGRPSEETVRENQIAVAQTLDSLGRSNFFALHSVQGANFAQVPTLTGNVEWLDVLFREDLDQRATGDRDAAFQITNPLTLFAASFALTLALLLLGSLYFQALARAALAGEGAAPAGALAFAGQVFLGWLRLIGYFGLLG